MYIGKVRTPLHKNVAAFFCISGQMGECCFVFSIVVGLEATQCHSVGKLMSVHSTVEKLVGAKWAN